MAVVRQFSVPSSVVRATLKTDIRLYYKSVTKHRGLFLFKILIVLIRDNMQPLLDNVDDWSIREILFVSNLFDYSNEICLYIKFIQDLFFFIVVVVFFRMLV